MPMQMKIDWAMLETVGAEIIPGGKTGVAALHVLKASQSRMTHAHKLKSFGMSQLAKTSYEL